jgi:hypothetical protein
MKNISFAKDIVTLFTSKDINCMKNFGVFLDDYQFMGEPSGDISYIDHANARHVYARLKGDDQPRMPKGGPYWSDEMLNKFEDWINGGFEP